MTDDAGRTRRWYLTELVGVAGVVGVIGGLPAVVAAAERGHRTMYPGQFVRIIGSNPNGVPHGSWTPDAVTVAKGTPVTLELESMDENHVFELPAFGIQESLYPGRPVEVTFTADKAGAFPYYCGRYCGPGHGDMTGTFYVTEGTA